MHTKHFQKLAKLVHETIAHGFIGFDVLYSMVVVEIDENGVFHGRAFRDSKKEDEHASMFMAPLPGDPTGNVWEYWNSDGYKVSGPLNPSLVTIKTNSSSKCVLHVTRPM